jgi:hypothetical protein
MGAQFVVNAKLSAGIIAEIKHSQITAEVLDIDVLVEALPLNIP